MVMHAPLGDVSKLSKASVGDAARPDLPSSQAGPAYASAHSQDAARQPRAPTPPVMMLAPCQPGTSQVAALSVQHWVPETRSCRTALHAAWILVRGPADCACATSHGTFRDILHVLSECDVSH